LDQAFPYFSLPMKKMIGWFPIVIGLGWSAPLMSQDTVRVGTFITSIYDIDLTQNSFSADLWLWFNYTSDSLLPLETVEFLNAKEADCPIEVLEQVDDTWWGSKKCRVVINQEWKVHKFPFDRQKMKLILEEGDKDIQQLVYLPDLENTRLDEELRLKDWEIRDFQVRSETKHYNSTYGDPRLTDGSDYSRLVIEILVERKGLGLFFTLFTGVYVSFFISMLVFFIDPIHVDPRFGLSVGSLFAAVGNKYIVDSILPQSVGFGLVDMIHALTYVFILLCIVFSVISLRFYKTGRMQQSKWLDRIAFFSLLSLYLILNLVFIMHAL
jgi:hypothetical protein